MIKKCGCGRELLDNKQIRCEYCHRKRDLDYIFKKTIEKDNGLTKGKNYEGYVAEAKQKFPELYKHYDDKGQNRIIITK